jgi:SAM-dependent methyltransferase
LTRTSERRTPGASDHVGDLVQDLFHLFPYHFVAEAASKEARVLEVGFGEGYGVEVLSEAVAEYVGVEVSEEAVEHASAYLARANVRFLLYDGARFPFESDSFDVVISFHVLEHLSNPQAFVAEVGRVCRPGGRIVLVTPNAAFRLGSGERPWYRFHVHEFTRDELVHLLSNHFSSFTVTGITGTETMVALERARVTRARRLSKLDPFGLRYRLPERLLLPVRRSLMRAAEGRRAAVEAPTFSLEDIRRVKADAGDAIHLLAVVER